MHKSTTSPTSIRLKPEEAERIRAAGDENCRSLTAELRYRALAWDEMKIRAERSEQALYKMLLGGQAQQRS
ncbi:hypothetical protein J7J47_11795 [Halomonas sp. ISL-60]|uniref:hypothetical protein n=1 Tax=Halomonas sp. ISL-56 TaxID=2819149 RepID=UPI001BEC4D4B|nr:hypothetical protein [Halomonas sp. ISL-56]MBT2772905.1 hypothetical protein [Halomonas sp. ISL-60]MBT2799952.1 hypothetical protein [Halomonas sp. ISL-56]